MAMAHGMDVREGGDVPCKWRCSVRKDNDKSESSDSDEVRTSPMMGGRLVYKRVYRVVLAPDQVAFFVVCAMAYALLQEVASVTAGPVKSSPVMWFYVQISTKAQKHKEDSCEIIYNGWSSVILKSCPLAHFEDVFESRALSTRRHHFGTRA